MLKPNGLMQQLLHSWLSIHGCMSAGLYLPSLLIEPSCLQRFSPLYTAGSGATETQWCMALCITAGSGRCMLIMEAGVPVG